MIQRQVSSRINNRDEGLAARIRRMLDDLRNFKIANPDAQKQMEDMLARVETDSRPAPRSGRAGPHARHQEPRETTPQAARRSPSPRRPSKRARAGHPADPAAARTTRRDADGAECESPGADKPAISPRARPATVQGPGAAPRPKAAEARRPARARPAKSQGDQPARRSPRRSERAAARRPRQGAETGAAKPADSATDSRARTRLEQALAEAKTNQKAIADELQKMLDGLSEFETYRGVVKDAQELLKQQEQTMKQTAEAAAKPEMIGQDARRA